MRLIVCLDDRNGMMFNGRRQSHDSVVCDRIIAESRDNELWMSAYSAKLFAGYEIAVRVDDNFLMKAKAEDVFFAEDGDVAAYAKKVDQLIVYKWNRHYPADKHFPMELFADMKMAGVAEEFPGNSHEKITMERYVR